MFKRICKYVALFAVTASILSANIASAAEPDRYAVSANFLSKNADFQDMASGEPAFRDTVFEDTVFRDAASGESAADNTAGKDTSAGESGGNSSGSSSSGSTPAVDAGKIASYANFRNVRAGSIGRNNLFRSAHPANKYWRAKYANQLAEENGIKTVLNLSNSKGSQARKFKKYKIDPACYYRTLFDQGRVYTAGMSPDCNFKRSSFRKKMVETLRFMAKNKGPYLIHCEIGRDRTGFMIMLLESLTGASYTYIVEDYTQSYINIDGYSYAKARRKAVSHVNDNYHILTGKSRDSDWSKMNLAVCVEKYLKKAGMSAGEIAALRRNLAVSYTKGGGKTKKTVDKETPAYRNLSFSNGKTIISKKLKAGKTLTLKYKLVRGDVKTYPVEYVNNYRSIVKVTACGKGRLKVCGLKKGKAVICLRDKKDHSMRIKVTIQVVD